MLTCPWIALSGRGSTMSAFTPYKKEVPSTGSEVTNGFLGGDLMKFPRELATFLMSLPQYRASLADANVEEEEEEEKKRKRNECFLMKNLLRRDDKERGKKEERKYEDHASRVETFVSNLGKSDHGHRCIYCGKIYSRKYGLKIHVRTHTGYKPLKCKYCARPFGDPSNLNKHVRLHAQGPTPYKCQFCDKLLVRRRDLERHIKSRHADAKGHASSESWSPARRQQ